MRWLERMFGSPAAAYAEAGYDARYRLPRPDAVIAALRAAAHAAGGRLPEEGWNEARGSLPGKDLLAPILGCAPSWPQILGAAGIEWRRDVWTQAMLLEALCAWHARYGEWPRMHDWSPAVANGIRISTRRRDLALARYADGCWPNASIVVAHFGSGTHGVEVAKATRPADAPAAA